MSKLLAIIVLIYLFYVAGLFLLQRQFLFPGVSINAPAAPAAAQHVEPLWVDTSFGRIEAWLIRPPDPEPDLATPAVVFAHGNGELIDHWVEEMSQVAGLGLSVLLVEYPGYGRSEGQPTQDTITEAFTAAYDRLTERRDIDSRRIALFGRSLGGGAVCALAAQRPAAALILLSTFASVRSFAHRFLVPAFLVRDPFDNVAVVRDFPGPILIAHGEYDALIPFHHATSLYEIAPRGRLVTYPCRHNDCPPDWKAFVGEINTFLQAAQLL